MSSTMSMNSSLSSSLSLDETSLQLIKTQDQDKCKVSSYNIRRVSKNKVNIEKYEKISSILDRKITRFNLSLEILLHVSQKVREKVDDLFYKSGNKKSDVKTKRNLNAIERQLSLEIQNDLYSENDRIMIEHKKIQTKLHVKMYKRNKIFNKFSYFYEMNELLEFIRETKSANSSSIIDFEQLSKLPAELILIIREYLPLEIRAQVLENTWNIPYIEYTEKPDCFAYQTIADLIVIMSNSTGNQAFWDHPISSVIGRRRCYDHSLYNFTIIFDASILLLKLLYPNLAFKVLMLIKNNNLHEFADTIYQKQLDILFPNNNLVSQNNQFSDWY